MNIVVLTSGNGSHNCSLFRIDNKLPAQPLKPIWMRAIEATSAEQKSSELVLTVEAEARKFALAINHFAARILYAEGMIAIPGFVDTHRHLWKRLSLARCEKQL